MGKRLGARRSEREKKRTESRSHRPETEEASAHAPGSENRPTNRTGRPDP